MTRPAAKGFVVASVLAAIVGGGAPAAAQVAVPCDSVGSPGAVPGVCTSEAPPAEPQNPPPSGPSPEPTASPPGDASAPPPSFAEPSTAGAAPSFPTAMDDGPTTTRDQLRIAVPLEQPASVPAATETASGDEHSPRPAQTVADLEADPDGSGLAGWRLAAAGVVATAMLALVLLGIRSSRQTETLSQSQQVPVGTAANAG